ncbi:MAG: phosphatase PAP2 family protein [Planctomycetota bacterium]|nr:MAG: phosphatase PAP2 family protein [Planctomycetota bacterium]
MSIPPRSPVAASPGTCSHPPPTSLSPAVWRSPAPRLVSMAMVLVALGTTALAIDIPVADWFKDGPWPPSIPRALVAVADEFHRVIGFSEVFAHTLGAAIILLTVLVLDRSVAWPNCRWPAIRWPSRQPTGQQQTFARMIGAAATGGLLTDIIKLLVDRVRPRAFDFAAYASVWDTFNEAVIATINGSRSDINSFPSGHSAVAAGLGAALAWKYPQGTWLFAIFALLAASQRIVYSAHFPSDACFGLAVGLLGAALFLRAPPGASAGS